MVETNAGDGRFAPGNVSPGNLVAVNRLVLLAAVPLFLVLALVAFPVWRDSVGRSHLAPYLLAGARAAVMIVPRELKDRFRQEYKKVVEVWNSQRNST